MNVISLFEGNDSIIDFFENKNKRNGKAKIRKEK